MTAFSKASLSPRRVPSEVVALPFGLTWRELAPALRIDAVAARSSLVATRRFELQGLRGEGRSAVVTVEGAAAPLDLFVKLVLTPERDTHAMLRRAGVPVPRLLAEAARGDDRAVLVFEFLGTVGIDTSDPAEVVELLELVARLNAVDVRAAGQLPPLPPGQPDAVFTASIVDALTQIRERGRRRALDVEQWLGAYALAGERAASMPGALTHGELYFQQVGRRAEGPLVLLDVATVHRRPRFSDVSSILAPLAAGLGETEADTLRRYLRALEGRGVAVPPVADALVELRWLRVHRAFQSLPWLTKSSTDPAIGRSHLDGHVATLEHDLVELGALR